MKKIIPHRENKETPTWNFLNVAWCVFESVLQAFGGRVDRSLQLVVATVGSRVMDASVSWFWLPYLGPGPGRRVVAFNVNCTGLATGCTGWFACGAVHFLESAGSTKRKNQPWPARLPAIFPLRACQMDQRATAPRPPAGAGAHSCPEAGLATPGFNGSRLADFAISRRPPNPNT